MKKIRIILLLALVLGLLAGCGSKKIAVNVTSDSLYVKQVANLPDDFIFGMDASSVLAEEASGVKYYNFAGEEQDVFKTLAENGITHIRVRVWNNPFDKDGNGYGGGNCDINTAVEIGKRATKYGLSLIVDFHYSDFWADPGKQMVPLAWKGMEIEKKSEEFYKYTKESLEKLKAAKVSVGMVQIGNETNGSFCGEKIWMNICTLFASGSKAIREVFPKALIAVHFANPEKGNYATYASKLKYYNLDYDVFASSYYPYWHGTLDNLASELTKIAEQYDKKVMVMETSYAYTTEDTDFFGNTISGPTNTIVTDYPFTVQGQANCVRNVTDTIVNKTKNGIGVCYWEGTWITVGTESYDKNKELWEKYGSGWASKASAAYDPNDAGKYAGGCAVDNQALFDSAGKPLESLKVFGLMKKGNEIEIVPDAFEDARIVVDLNAKIELPATVNAVMTDDSKVATPVNWEVNENDYLKMKSNGPAVYTVTGKAQGKEVHCIVSMIEYNFLKNYSFEDEDASMWKMTANKKSDELYVEDKVTDSLTGSKHYHFWSANTDTVNFDLEQTAENVPSGTYRFTISIMGGDCGTTNIYAYIKINGEIVAKTPLSISGYGNWDTQATPEVTYNEGDTLICGIHVECSGEGNGAWGKIDDALLNSVSK